MLKFFCEYAWFLTTFHQLKVLYFEQMSADIKFHTWKCLILILLTEKLPFLKKTVYWVAIIFKFSSLYPLAENIEGLILQSVRCVIVKYFLQTRFASSVIFCTSGWTKRPKSDVFWSISRPHQLFFNLFLLHWVCVTLCKLKLNFDPRGGMVNFSGGTTKWVAELFSKKSNRDVFSIYKGLIWTT